MKASGSRRVEALRALVEAFGGNPPDWLLPEYNEACEALNTPEPLYDTAPELCAALSVMVGMTDMIGRSRFRYAAEYDRFACATVRARAAIAKAGGAPIADPRPPTEAAVPAFTDADLFNCWTGGIEPSTEERARWRGLEVHGVRDVSEPGEDGTQWDACDDADAEMWSVYGLLKEGGCECITDGPAGDRVRTMQIADHLARRWGLKVEIG